MDDEFEKGANIINCDEGLVPADDKQGRWIESASVCISQTLAATLSLPSCWITPPGFRWESIIAIIT